MQRENSFLDLSTPVAAAEGAGEHMGNGESKQD